MSKKDTMKSTQYDKWELKQRYKCREWQGLRKDIINKRGRKCQVCNDWGYKRNPLQLHHKYYLKNKNHPVWDYPDDCFLVVCENCHQNIHKQTRIMYHHKHPSECITRLDDLI